MGAFDYCTKQWVTITNETDFERFIKFQNGEIDERFIEEVATSDELLINHLNKCVNLVYASNQS